MQQETSVRDIPGLRLASYVARAVEARRYRQSRGKLCSAKMGRHMDWTSFPQRDALILLELRHSVRAYTAWPGPVPVPSCDGVAEYHPSIGATLADGNGVLIDLVRPSEAGTPERKAFDALLASAAAGLGLKLVVMREDAVSNDRLLPNAREVMRAVGRAVDPGAEGSCRRMLSGGAATLGALRRNGPDGQRQRDAACILAMRRLLRIDLDAPDADGCTVSLPAQEAA